MVQPSVSCRRGEIPEGGALSFAKCFRSTLGKTKEDWQLYGSRGGRTKRNMPSLYQPWCRSDPTEARIANLIKARRSPRFHKPRPWRSSDESHMIRRFAFLWFTCRDPKRPSGRSWARQLGVSHTWLQKLVREFSADPTEMFQLQTAEGDPQFSDLSRAREDSEEMRGRGELRPLRMNRF